MAEAAVLVPTGEAWEYASLELPNGAALSRINDLDVDGWHLVSMISAPSGLGASYFAIVRRAIEPLPDPPSWEAGWYPDRSRRHESRYWNGRAWTHVVGDDGKQSRDAPTLLPPTPGLRVE